MKNTAMTIYLAAFLLMPIIAHTQSPNEQSLLGSWQCESILHASLYESDKSRFAEGWAPDADGLTVALKSARLQFQHNGDSYTVSSSSPNPFVISSTEAVTSPFRVIAGQLVLRYESSGVNYFYEIRNVDETRLELVPQSGTTFPTLACSRLTTSARTADIFAFGREVSAMSGNTDSVYIVGNPPVVNLIVNNDNKVKKIFLDGSGEGANF